MEHRHDITIWILFRKLNLKMTAPCDKRRSLYSRKGYFCTTLSKENCYGASLKGGDAVRIFSTVIYPISLGWSHKHLLSSVFTMPAFIICAHSFQAIVSLESGNHIEGRLLCLCRFLSQLNYCIGRVLATIIWQRYPWVILERQGIALIGFCYSPNESITKLQEPTANIEALSLCVLHN